MMKKKFSNNLINILVIALCIISACASVYVPKLLLNNRMNQSIDKVNVVPTEYYSGPSVAVVKSASRQLSASTTGTTTLRLTSSTMPFTSLPGQM